MIDPGFLIKAVNNYQRSTHLLKDLQLVSDEPRQSYRRATTSGCHWLAWSSHPIERPRNSTRSAFKRKGKKSHPHFPKDTSHHSGDSLLSNSRTNLVARQLLKRHFKQTNSTHYPQGMLHGISTFAVSHQQKSAENCSGRTPITVAPKMFSQRRKQQSGHSSLILPSLAQRPEHS